MNLLSSIFSNYFILLAVGAVIIIVVANLITSMLKKGGEVAVVGSVSLTKNIFKGIILAIIFIKDIIVLIWTVIKLMLVYFFTKR